MYATTATAAALALAAGCSTATPAKSPTVIEQISQESCRGNAYATAALAQNLGESAPRCVDDTWTFAIPAADPAFTPRRTEVAWGLRKGGFNLTEGSELTFEALVSARLGPAGTSDDDWHVFWQFVGTTAGEWRAPNFQIGVRHGKLRLWGGASHPDHKWTGPDFSWSRDLADFSDDRVYRVRVRALLSTDPAMGTLDAWVDGAHLVQAWHPVSAQGLRPSTMVPEHADLHVRSGLYRGTDAPHAPPTYAQSVTMRVLEMK